ncbi:MAG TPA: outer membrane lipoprotein-sorting protein [Bacteroidota bacterium]|nr:outer membrane lipoprotein-sorting protein [Bacteroidota bacterium]
MRRHCACAILLLVSLRAAAQAPDGDEILNRVDRNMFAETKIVQSRMVIHGRRETRTVESKSWQRGTDESYTEFTAPAREKGTKMLKLKDMLWEYSPSTDRTIMISGHLLRQSVMGSDLSYEDMMDDPHLPNMYTATVASGDTVDGRRCWVLNLAAKKTDIAYDHRTVWVDRERYILLKEELYAKSGKLLKSVDVREVMRVKDHWLAKSVLYKDVLKEGEGTEFFSDDVTLDAPIPDYLLSKASLRR